MSEKIILVAESDESPIFCIRKYIDDIPKQTWVLEGHELKKEADAKFLICENGDLETFLDEMLLSDNFIEVPNYVVNTIGAED